MIKQYISINLASPEKILKWTQRINETGEIIGEIKSHMIILKLDFNYIKMC